MKRIVLSILFLIGLSTQALPQIIESFDTQIDLDSTYQWLVEGPNSRIDYSVNTTDVKQGTSSADFKFVIGSVHEWGSYGQLVKRLPAGQYFDWQATDSLALWIKVITAPAMPVNMVFRIHIADRPTP